MCPTQTQCVLNRVKSTSLADTLKNEGNVGISLVKSCVGNVLVEMVYYPHILAITILSVRPSVTRKQARIIKSSPSAAWKTIVSGTVKLFHKFEGGHSERGR